MSISFGQIALLIILAFLFFGDVSALKKKINEIKKIIK